MFFRLILTPMGIMSAFTGFILFVVLNLVGKRGVVLALWGGVLGAFGLFLAWCLLSYLLLMLFSADEINRIFFHKPDLGLTKKTPQPQPTTEFNTGDGEDELTAEDLYAAPDYIPQSYEPAPSPFQQKVKKETKAKLDAEGRFNLESNSRSVRTNAKEAALAARKVLMNDKQ
ncbi:MAG: hypothetical protein ACRCY4_02500 [Brevinema sp.]